jgi:hypothetical protein
MSCVSYYFFLSFTLARRTYLLGLGRGLGNRDGLGVAEGASSLPSIGRLGVCNNRRKSS